MFFILQIYILPSFNGIYFLQMVVMDLLIVIGIYAFRGFEVSNPISINKKVVSFSSGTLLGTLLSIIFILFFQIRLNQIFIIITFILFSIIYPFLYGLMLKKYIKNLPVRKFLIIGKKEEFENLMNEIEEKSLMKVKAWGYMNPSPVALSQALEKQNAFDSILIANPDLVSDVSNVIERAKINGITLEYLPNLVETYLGRIPLEVIERYRNYYDPIFSSVEETQAKRIYDILLACLAIILTSPIMLILSIIIPIESGFPIIFKQTRIGKGKKPFKFYKFRSLKEVDADYLKEHKDPNETIQMRVTKAGKVIRKIRFDEIPQFFNVLNNTMSMIGPRPEMENYHEQCMEKIPYYEYRYKYKPGITGWAQINYKHTSGMDDYKVKTEYDLYYIKNRNIFMDLEITLKTIETMLGMRGAK